MSTAPIGSKKTCDGVRSVWQASPEWAGASTTRDTGSYRW